MWYWNPTFIIIKNVVWYLVNCNELRQSCCWSYCHFSPFLPLDVPPPVLISGEQLSRAWPEVLCGSAVAGSNSSTTLKPLSGDSSKCLWCGSLDSLQLFFACSLPFPLLSLFLWVSHIHTNSHSLTLRQWKTVPTPLGCGQYTYLWPLCWPFPAWFMCMVSAWILTPRRNCYYLINAVIVFFYNWKMGNYGCVIRSPHFGVPPPPGPVVLINNEFQLDTLAL